MNWQEMLEQVAALTKQAQTLLTEAGDAITDEQKDKVDVLLAKAEGLQADAVKARGNTDREERLKKLQAAMESKERAPALARASAPTLDADKFKDWAEFLVAVKHGRDPRLTPIESLMSGNERKALAEGAGASGGFLVPPEHYSQMLEISAEEAIVRPRAFLMPMGSRSITFPKLNQVEAPDSGHTAFYGGVALEWFEENTDLDEMDIEFRMGELVAHGLGGWLPVPNNLIANSAVSLGAMIPRLFGGAANWAVDYACLQGDGVAKPLGIIAAPVTEWIVRAVDDQFAFVDAVGMLAAFLASSWGRGVWVMSQSVLPQLYQMVDGLGQHVWLPNASEKGPGTLLGIPIVFTEKLPVLGDRGDVLLCDFGYYILGDRELPTVAASTHERFRRNQTTYRITQWVDGQPWLDDQIKLADGVTEVSPFVGLDEAAPD